MIIHGACGWDGVAVAFPGGGGTFNCMKQAYDRRIKIIADFTHPFETESHVKASD